MTLLRQGFAGQALQPHRGRTIRIRAQPSFGTNDMMHLAPDAVFSWYVLQVVGGQETITASHLVGRRFGVYCPMETIVLIENRRKITTQRAMFPGYLFVYSWSIAEHWPRIMACPGALKILGDDDPAEISDGDIRLIQSIENWQTFVFDHTTACSHRRRRRKSRRARARNLDKRAQISSMSAKLGLKRPDSVSRDARLGAGSR